MDRHVQAKQNVVPLMELVPHLFYPTEFQESKSVGVHSHTAVTDRIIYYLIGRTGVTWNISVL